MLILETDRIFLREMTQEDADFILKLLNDPAYIQNIGDRGIRTHHDARKYLQEKIIASYIQHGYGLFLVVDKQTNLPVGCCGLINRESLADIDIGYAFLPEFRGQGYATESAKAVLAYGKTKLGLKRIVGITAVDNQGSINVLEKIGLHFEEYITLPGDDEEIMLFGWDA